jgi:hypothetical protein
MSTAVSKDRAAANRYARDPHRLDQFHSGNRAEFIPKGRREDDRSVQ